MKLQDLVESTFFTDPTHEGYTKYLKDRRLWKEPNLKGKKGYVLKNFVPENNEKAYKTLDDARRAASKRQGAHWQIFDAESGKPVAKPRWVDAETDRDWRYREGY